MTSKALILAIDDEQYYLNELKYEFAGKNVELKTFLGPSSFEETATTEDIERAELILIDYDFRSCTSVDRDLPRYIKTCFKFSGKLALISLLEDFGEETEIIRSNYDAIFQKETFSWADIEKLLKKEQSLP